MLFMLPLQFFVLRKLIEHAWVRKGYDHKHAYICSLSSQSIVYKGQLLPAQVLQRCSRLHPSPSFANRNTSCGQFILHLLKDPEMAPGSFRRCILQRHAPDSGQPSQEVSCLDDDMLGSCQLLFRLTLQ